MHLSAPEEWSMRNTNCQTKVPTVYIYPPFYAESGNTTKNQHLQDYTSYTLYI